MAGYNWLGKTAMSNNAMTALEEGLLPLHKITRELVDSMGGRGAKIADVRKAAETWDCATEWHHTGSNFKKTFFIDRQGIGRAITLAKSDDPGKLWTAWRKRGGFATIADDRRVQCSMAGFKYRARIEALKNAGNREIQEVIY